MLPFPMQRTSHSSSPAVFFCPFYHFLLLYSSPSLSVLVYLKVFFFFCIVPLLIPPFCLWLLLSFPFPFLVVSAFLILLCNIGRLTSLPSPAEFYIACVQLPYFDYCDCFYSIHRLMFLSLLVYSESRGATKLAFWQKMNFAVKTMKK